MEKETRRKRLSQTCGPCRRKKTKCDGMKPCCGKCKRLNESCLYTSKSYRKSAKELDELDMRLKNIEKAMQSISSRRHVPKQISRNERHLLLCTTAIPDHIYSETPILPYNVDNHLFPSLEITLEIVDIYFTHLHIIAPVLDRGAFVQSIIHKTCSPFILYAMLAVAARFSKRPEVLEEPIWMSGEKYASRAREMIGDVIETACLDHIQGFLLLCFHEYGCDQAHRCWMYAGIAARMASQIELGTELMYNIEPGTVFSIKEWTDFETRRKVFWNIYINDKFSSVCTGRPSFLELSECNLLLPTGFRSCPEHDFSQESPDQSTIVHYHLHRDENDKVTGIEYTLSDSRISEYGFEGVMINGAILMSKVIRFLPRFDGINAEFIQLNRKLDNWFNQLPPMFKETKANLDRCKCDDSDFTTNYVLVHAFHKCLIVLLNRPLLDMPHEEIPEATSFDSYTSLDKCISAANSVAMLLKGLNDRVENVPPMASYLTYIVGTVAINNGFSPNKHESQKADVAGRMYLHFLGKMRVYWGTVDKLYCMMIDLYNINKKILEAPLPTCLIDYTHNNLIMHDIDDPSADPFTTCSTEENIYDRFSTIDEFSFNSTPSIFHLNDWLIE